MDIKKALLIGGGVVGGLIVVNMIAKNAAASAVANADIGSTVIGGQGPLVSLPADSSTGTTSNLSSELGQVIEGQVRQAVEQASVAKNAVGITANSELLSTILGKGTVKGQSIDVAYNDSGQITHVGQSNALKNLTQSATAKEAAKSNTITQKEVLASISRGFTGIGSTLADSFRTIYDAKGKKAAEKAVMDATKAANKAGVDLATYINSLGNFTAQITPAGAQTAAATAVNSAGLGK